MFSTRFYEQKDYPMICKWWRAWDWEPFPEICLSPTGIIVQSGGYDVAIVFLYKTDSNVCWAENFLVNKEVPKEHRKGAVDFLIQEVSKLAKELGFFLMMSSVKHKGLIDKMIKNGYENNPETGMTNLMKVL